MFFPSSFCSCSEPLGMLYTLPRLLIRLCWWIISLKSKYFLKMTGVFLLTELWVNRMLLIFITSSSLSKEGYNVKFSECYGLSYGVIRISLLCYLFLTKAPFLSWGQKTQTFLFFECHMLWSVIKTTDIGWYRLKLEDKYEELVWEFNMSYNASLIYLHKKEILVWKSY